MRTVITSPITAIVLIVLVVLVAFALFGNLQKLGARDEELQRLQARLADIQQENAAIEANITSLETEAAIEAEARQRLNLKKQGEEVVVVVPKEGERAQTLSDEEFLRQYEQAQQTEEAPRQEEMNFVEWVRQILSGVLGGREEVIE